MGEGSTDEACEIWSKIRYQISSSFLGLISRMDDAPKNVPILFRFNANVACMINKIGRAREAEEYSRT